MKNRNRAIVGLLVLGIAFFAVVQFLVVPLSDARQEKYLAAQQEPATHDLAGILKYKNRYMGNTSNDVNLFNHLPLSQVGMNFQLFSSRLELEVNYKDTVWDIGEERVKRSLLYNSTAAFALIGNLKVIDYNFPGASYQVKRENIEALYPDFSHILKEATWKNSVQGKMDDSEYIESAFQKAIQVKSS